MPKRGSSADKRSVSFHLPADEPLIVSSNPQTKTSQLDWGRDVCEAFLAPNPEQPITILSLKQRPQVNG